MTEAQIERIAEQRMDALDARLMKHQVSQVEYYYEVRNINVWVNQTLTQAKRENAR